MKLFEGLFKEKRYRSSYSKGIRTERRVATKLRSKGYIVRQSKGSRGPYDLYAMKGGRKLLIQVKSGCSSFSRRERIRLRRVARSKSAKAILIRVKGRGSSSKFVY